MSITSLERSFADTVFVTFDTETTGREPARARLLEIGALRSRGLEAVEVGDSFAQLVRPDTPIPRDSQRTHGIREEEVRDCPGPRTALERFAAWLASSPEAILVAHNASFDIDMISYACARADLPVPPNLVLDTLTFARRTLPGLPSYSLENLARGLNLPRQGRLHRALEDARLTQELFRYCARRVIEQGLTTVEQALELTGQPLTFREAGPLPEGSDELVATIRRAAQEHSELSLELNRGAGSTTSQKVRPLAVYPAPVAPGAAGPAPGALIDIHGDSEEGVVQLQLTAVVKAQIAAGGQQLLFG